MWWTAYHDQSSSRKQLKRQNKKQWQKQKHTFVHASISFQESKKITRKQNPHENRNPENENWLLSEGTYLLNQVNTSVDLHILLQHRTQRTKPEHIPGRSLIGGHSPPPLTCSWESLYPQYKDKLEINLPHRGLT